MKDLTFEYKGRKLFIDMQKLSFSPKIIFTLYDVTKLNNEIIDFSEKELAKVEILDYLKNDVLKDLQKSVIMRIEVPLKDFITKGYNIFPEIKKEFLKELEKK